MPGGKYTGGAGGDGYREKVLYQGSGPNPESRGGLTMKDTPSGVGSGAEAGSPAWRLCNNPPNKQRSKTILSRKALESRLCLSPEQEASMSTSHPPHPH